MYLVCSRSKTKNRQGGTLLGDQNLGNPGGRQLLPCHAGAGVIVRVIKLATSIAFARSRGVGVNHEDQPKLDAKTSHSRVKS